MDRVRFQVGEGPIAYVTTPEDAEAFAKALRAAGETTLADRVAGAITTNRRMSITITKDDGAQAALGVLDATEGESWHSVTFEALREALRAYLDA